jgi:L-threonine-O-3-phosphate decarboxylase
MPVERPMHGGNLVWAATVAGCSPDAILDFSASINPLGLPASAIAVLQNCWGDLRTYPDPNYTRLRSAIAEFHHISADWVLPGNGAAELLTWASRDLAELDTTLLLTPAFSDYYRALKAFSAHVTPHNFWSAAHQSEQTLTYQLAVSSRDSVAYFRPSISPTPLTNLSAAGCPLPAASHRGLLLNNPHNPTGQIFSRESVLSLLKDFALVVVDEAFMDFLPPDDDQSVLEWVQDYPNLVVVRSLTKFYSLPGLRLGYAIAHPDRLRRWRQWRDPWTVNAIAAAVGEVVVRDAPFQQQTWNWLAEARPHLLAGLAALPTFTPFLSAANFLLVKAECSVVELQRQLLVDHQILIRDCLSFAELGDRYFRVAIRTPAENQNLLDQLVNKSTCEDAAHGIAGV